MTVAIVVYKGLIPVVGRILTIIIDHGKNIPEHLNFQPGNSKKDQEYMKRIEEYKLQRQKN